MKNCRATGRANPVDIIGDASPVRFRMAVKACLDDPNVDGVLVIFTRRPAPTTTPPPS